MKLLLSADMEGTAGIAAWEETAKGSAEYAYFRQLMTEEVCAACRGALASGNVTELLVRDAGPASQGGEGPARLGGRARRNGLRPGARV